MLIVVAFETVPEVAVTVTIDGPTGVPLLDARGVADTEEETEDEEDVPPQLSGPGAVIASSASIK
jgi:hypothetical protein